MTVIKRSDIKRGFKFWWEGYSEYSGQYEVICFRKDLSVILCYKPVGKRRTINEESLAKFDERIINNKEFSKLNRKQND